MKKLYSTKNKKSSEEYTNLCDEFIAIYNNMPVASLTLKEDGTIKEYNNEYKNLIEKIYNKSIDSFNFLSDRIFITEDDFSKLKSSGKLEKTVIINKGSSNANSLYIKLIIRTLKYNSEINYLVLIIDNTLVTGQRKEIEDTNVIINKALVESKIGLCHFNLFDNKGFATKTWFDNLCINNTVPIPDSFVNIPKEDYKHIEDYINEIKNIQLNENQYIAFAENNYRKTFNCTVKVKEKTYGHEYYLRVYSEVSKYNPDEGEIIVDFITINIDAQKEREHVLEQTYIKTKEAEELKQSFIVNMGNEIHTPLNTITLSCLQLFNKSNIKEEKLLFEKIELNTNKLLKIINNVVNIPKEKFNNTEVEVITNQNNTQTIQKAPVTQSANVTTQKTLLIAEDNENNYQLLRYMIKTKYKIIHAWNGDEAVLMYKKLNPDLILMDIKMPVMDGYQATQIIRNTDSIIPIIAITAYAFDNDKSMILNSGFSDYLSKPVNETEFFKMLNKYLQN